MLTAIRYHKQACRKQGVLHAAGAGRQPRWRPVTGWRLKDGALPQRSHFALRFNRCGVEG